MYSPFRAKAGSQCPRTPPTPNRPLPSRHSVPALPWSLVSRSRLETLLDGQHRRHITLVTGLPEAGKTTLVASWLHLTDRPAVWCRPRRARQRGRPPSGRSCPARPSVGRAGAAAPPTSPGHHSARQRLRLARRGPLGPGARRRARAALRRRPRRPAPCARPRRRPCRSCCAPGPIRRWPSAGCGSTAGWARSCNRPRVHGGRGLRAVRRLRHRAAPGRRAPLRQRAGLGGRPAAGGGRPRRSRRPPRAGAHGHQPRPVPAGGGARPPGRAHAGFPAARAWSGA